MKWETFAEVFPLTRVHLANAVASHSVLVTNSLFTTVAK